MVVVGTRKPNRIIAKPFLSLYPPPKHRSIDRQPLFRCLSHRQGSTVPLAVLLRAAFLRPQFAQQWRTLRTAAQATLNLIFAVYVCPGWHGGDED